MAESNSDKIPHLEYLGMVRSFGLYLGRTSASVAVFQDGKWEMVANDAGDRVTPAVVSFTDQDLLVGEAARHELIRNEQNTLCGAKELIGQSADEEYSLSQSSVKTTVKNGMIAYEVNYKEKKKVVAPHEVVELIYKNLSETASRHCTADSHDAVLTAPVNFTCEQCTLLREAAEKAGFNVLRIITEPSAAVLAYGLNEVDTDSIYNILVYRLGGTTLEVSIIQVLGGLLHTVATVSDNEVNGQVLDDLLVDHLASEFQRRWRADCRSNKRSVMKLRLAAENCRKTLSTLPSANCSVESLFDGIDFQVTVSRSRFDGLCATFLQQCLTPVEDVLSQASMQKEDIHKVVLAGGCTKMPSLQQKLLEFLPSATLLSSIPPDEVIAVGAAIQAGILTNSSGNSLPDVEPDVVPCVSVTILCKLGDDGNQTVSVFHKFTPLPTHKRILLQLNPSQTEFSLDLLEQSVIGDVLVGRVTMRDVNAGSLVEVNFDMDRDGALRVHCIAGEVQQKLDIPAVSHGLHAS